MSLLNRFGPYSNSWHIVANFDMKHTVHSMGDHDMACMTWAWMTWACMTWPCMTWACTARAYTAWTCTAWTCLAVKTYDAHLRKKCQCFPTTVCIAEYFFADWKMEPDWKYKCHPAYTSLTEDLSTDTTFDPSYITWDTPFKTQCSSITQYKLYRYKQAFHPFSGKP